MNTQKRNYDEGWVMCPSKSFPGKCYYFNVVTGEALWSFTDVEKAITKNNIQRVTDRWHSYPEPNTPPTDERPQNWQFRRLDYPQGDQQFAYEARPLFGQAVFPKHAPNEPHMSNFMRTSVPIPPSMYVGSNSYMKPEPMFTVNHSPQAWEMRNMLLQNEPKQFQFHQERNGHERFLNVNKSDQFQRAGHENLFNVNKRNFQNAQDNLFQCKDAYFQNYQEKNYNEKITNSKSNHFQRAYEKSPYESFNNIKPSTNPFQNPKEKNNNIFLIENFSKTPTKIGWGFHGQNKSLNFVRQNVQSISNVNNNQVSQPPSTSIEEPIVNRITSWPVNGTKSNKTMFRPKPDSLGPRIDKIPKQVQFHQNNVRIFGSQSNATACFGGSDLSPQKRPYAIGQLVSPQKRFQVIGQSEIQAEKSNGNQEDLDDSACFDMTYSSPEKKPGRSVISPQKRYQNAKHITISHEIPEDPDDSVFDMSKISPKKRLIRTGQSQISPQKKLQYTGQSEISPKKRLLCNGQSEISPQKIFLTEINQPASNETSLSVRKRVSSTTTNNLTVEDENFDQTDLRHVLLAKRMKKVDFTDTQNKGKIVKTRYSSQQEKDQDISPKKRVTFEDHLSIIEDMSTATAEDLSVNTLHKLGKPHTKAEHWYIVAHADVLLEDFEFIEKFVQADDKCVLVVPAALRALIDSWCVGDCRGRRRVLAARRLSRRLASPPQHITVHKCEEDTNTEMSVNDSVLNCCFALNENYHVVLITNDKEMSSQAKSMDLHCFTLQEIMEHAAMDKPEVSFELRKITKENRSNEPNQSLVMVIENQLPKLSLGSNKIPKRANKLLFQVANDSNPSRANGEAFPVNCYRKRMFDDNNDENNNDPFLFSRPNDTSMTEKRCSSQKSTINPKISADCEENLGMFSPRNMTQLNRSKSHDYESDKESAATTSEISWHIQKLNLKGPKVDKRNEESAMPKDNPSTFSNTDYSKTCNVPKLNKINRYTIEEHLKRFIVKHAVAEERIKARIEEWVCSFTQIMEETLSDVLQHHSCPLSNNLPPPWMLPEAAERIRDVYGSHTSIRIVVEKLAALLFENSCKKGYLKFTMTANDFMKILGCGILLIQCLTNILPGVASLLEAEGSLCKLLEDMTQASPDAASPHTAPPRVSSRCELSEPLTEDRRNFVKKSSEIISYLKTHFAVWDCDNPSDDQDLKSASNNKPQEKSQQTTEVIRTFGRNLNGLVLKRSADNKNNETDKDVLDINTKEKGLFVKENSNVPVEKESGAKLLRKLALKRYTEPNKTKLKEIDIKKREENDKVLITMINQITTGKTVSADDNMDTGNVDLTVKEPTLIRKYDFALKNTLQSDKRNIDSNPPVNNDDFLQSEEQNTGPKVIRKTNVLNVFEEKLNKKLEADTVNMDYSELDYEADIYNDAEQNDATENEPNYEIDVEKNYDPPANNELEKTNDVQNSNDADVEDAIDTTDDSGFETECHHAHAVAKMFFTELSGTFKIIYRYLDDSVQELRKDDIKEETRRLLHDEASITQTHVAIIIDKLKNIIQRESGGGTTLMELLEKAGANVSDDKRMTQYRRVVTKCLEQALLLESAVRALAGATRGPPPHRLQRQST